MEVNNKDETRPLPDYRENQFEPYQGETLPTPVHQQNPESSDLSQTVPTPLERPDLSQTVATPAKKVLSEHAGPGVADFTQVNESSDSQQAMGQTAPSQVRDRPAQKQDIEEDRPSDLIGLPSSQAGIDHLPPPPLSLPPKTARRLPSWRIWTLLGLLALILIAATSAMAGYRSGIIQRQSAESTQIAGSLQTQYELALQEMDAGQYTRARQRLEYIIKINPGYPGVTEKLADVLLSVNSTATPTVAPTPTLTPTPDTRGVDEKFSQAQQFLANGDWSGAIETLLNLRKADPNFQPVLIDGMLYMALRNRGRDKILKNSDLEGGIYDLTLSERFGPLDAESKSYQTWAELYLRGASFWELDWSQAVYYFAQVAPALPNLRDGSGLTATERYRQSLVGYGETFAKEEDWCNAMAQYEAALAVGTDDEVQAAYEEAAQNCSGESDEEDEEETEPPAETESPAVTPSETAPVDVTPTPGDITPEAPPATEPPPSTEAPQTTEVPQTTEAPQVTEAPVEPTPQDPSTTPSP